MPTCLVPPLTRQQYTVYNGSGLSSPAEPGSPPALTRSNSASSTQSGELGGPAEPMDGDKLAGVTGDNSRTMRLEPNDDDSKLLAQKRTLRLRLIADDAPADVDLSTDESERPFFEEFGPGATRCPVPCLYRVKYRGSLDLEPWGSMCPHPLVNIAFRAHGILLGRVVHSGPSFLTREGIQQHLEFKVGMPLRPPFTPCISLFSSLESAQRFALMLREHGHERACIVTISTDNFVPGYTNLPATDTFTPPPNARMRIYAANLERAKTPRYWGDFYIRVQDALESLHVPPYEGMQHEWLAINFVHHDDVTNLEYVD